MQYVLNSTILNTANKDYEYFAFQNGCGDYICIRKPVSDSVDQKSKIKKYKTLRGVKGFFDGELVELASLSVEGINRCMKRVHIKNSTKQTRCKHERQ